MELTAKMKTAFVSTGPTVEIVDSVVPEPGPAHVLIKVVVAGSNPKDWKVSEYHGLQRFNSGDDIAGVVHAVGPGVSEFQPGDRVASMHNSATPAGAYAEYAIGPVDTTFHIPDGTSFEEAATIPLAALTAAVLLHRGLGAPEPFSFHQHAVHMGPLVVYGGASAVGAFAIQLAKRSGFGPIIAVAGSGISFATSLLDLDQGDAVVDYRAGSEAVVAGIRAALKGAKLKYAFDAVRTGGSYFNLCMVLESDTAEGTKASKLVTSLPIPNLQDRSHPAANEARITDVEYSDERNRDFGYVYSRYLSKGLRDGWLRPHPIEVQPGGLNGIEEGLRKMKAGEASATKYVYRVKDTPGLEA
ncbi:chaperonin 10-like protein [Ilyonectria destructans]|nr:chaperonin 10-like protein [Ilyonectria destructans]